MSTMELRKKSQITIPRDIIEKLSIHEGDKFEFAEKDGIIYMMPVSIYPKKYVEELEKIAAETKEKVNLGIIPTFDKVSDMFAHLDS
jgi:AbrB family looped-hinge helix DNA binding protein